MSKGLDLKTIDNKIHWSFWLIAVVGLLWNIGGSINFIMQMNQEFVSTLPETHRAIIEGRPLWATGGFAFGVFAGMLGSILLLLKKSTAFYVFVLSLFGIVLTMVHTVEVANSKISFSPVEIIVMIILPVIVAAGLIAYSKFAINKCWVK
jgi:hypothetical protein